MTFDDYKPQMKSNPIMIIKSDHSKKRSGPVDLKRKVGSLPLEIPRESELSKIQTKPKTTSKSQQKNIQLNFSKSFLISNRFQNKNTSSERLKSSSGKGRNSKLERQSPSLLIKIEKSSHHTSKITHYHSTDKETKREKANSNSKSYLINYLNHRNHSTKADSLSKLDKLRKDQRSKTEMKKAFVGDIKYASRTRQGTLITNPNKPNQDSFLIKQHPQLDAQVFVVADGHGLHGHFVSQLATSRINKLFQEKYSKSKNGEIFLADIYNKIQTELFETKDMNAYTSGSTLISMLIQNENKLTCANVGDSRAILARQIDKKNWEIIHLSEDHKPSLDRQKKRILKKGGKVHSYKDESGQSIGPMRVWLPNQNLQGLAMSRSMGDNVSKPIGVIHEPDFVHLELTEKDKFILIGSDGIWEFVKNFQVLQLVVPYYKAGKLEQCCDALLKLAYERWTVEDSTVIDDITFILIFFNQL